MNAPERQILLKVDERVFSHLSKMADALGRSASRYALELFEAAYAVRCGVADDAPLASRIAKISDTRSAPALQPPTRPAADPAELAKVKRERDALQAKVDGIPALETWILKLKDEVAEAKAAAGRIPGLEAAVETIRGERDRARQDLKTTREKHLSDRENLEHEISALSESLRDQEFATESWIASHRQAARRADELQAAIDERAALWSEITSLQRLGATLGQLVGQLKFDSRPVLVGDYQTLRFEPIDESALTMLSIEHTASEPEVLIDEPPAPSTDPAPKADAKPEFIWKKSWGRG